MAAQLLFCNTLVALLIFFLSPLLSKSVSVHCAADDSSKELPRFSFSWPDDVWPADDNEFYTGENVTIKVKVQGNYNPEDFKFPFNPNISVNDTKGNSSYITELHSDFGNDTNNWRILFTPIMAGFFHMLITDDHFKVHDSSLNFHVAPAEPYKEPFFMFHWLDDRRVFRAGEPLSIRATVSNNENPKTYKYPFNPNMTLSKHIGRDDRMGNSSYITGYYNSFGKDIGDFRIHFIPIMAGHFFMWIHQEHLMAGSLLQYDTTPVYSNYFIIVYCLHEAEIYVPGGIVSWMGDDANFVAGSKAAIKIIPKDSFCNDVTLSEGQRIENIVVFATHEHGSDARVLDVNNIGWNRNGYLTFEFTVITSGSLLLHVKYENSHLIRSPLPFTVDPGPLDVGNCVPKWETVTNNFQLFSTMETFITQRDRFGNLVPGFYDFEFEVIEAHSRLALPIGDLKYEEVVPGIQSFSFKLLAPGEFLLIITDKDKKGILNIPYQFTIFIAYCDGLKSIVNGSGLHNSIAGQSSKFTILLRDAYEYPSPIELHRLRVQITLPTLSIEVEPRISPIDSVNGTLSTGMQSFGAFNPSVPSDYLQSGDVATWPSAFEVEYVPKTMGWYDIRVFCGNVPLNDGKPFIKFVRGSGVVNISTSRTVNYETQVSSLGTHSVDIELKDSYYNPVLLPDSELSKLSFETKYLPITVILFINNKDGTYTCFYSPLVVDIYELCAFYNGNRINPCPFTVTTFKKEDFPIAYGTDVSCWEDESIGFEPLANDYTVSGKRKLVGHEKPRHGSIVLYGETFRYTPYKRYYGNDSFKYSISDANGVLVASSKVNVFVHTVPPQFVSFPTELHADEDMLSPKFGGFSGFEFTYSDFRENISISFSAKHGSLVLSPLLIQLWDPMWDELSITKMEGGNNELILTARLEVINFAVKSLKYIGEGNFSGGDTLRVSTINKYGKRDLDVPLIVNPINDPPFIDAPEFIILGNVTEDEGYLIFDKKRDNFTFSIGDPDYAPFPEKRKSNFRVMFSVEVSSGYFTASLPAVLISTTELKLKNSNQWQPLLTFVEISKQVTVKAKAIRFRGTLDDCNTLLQQIFYYGGENGGVLKVSVNDMGWHGCYPDCEEMMMSVPLMSQATIKLVTKTPVDSMVAHSLGSVIAIESIVLSWLAAMLIFFTCKCLIHLLHKKIKDQDQSQNMQLYNLQSSHSRMSSTDSSEDMAEQPSSLSNPLPEKLEQVNDTVT
ncbi:hypothetical protein LXL04_029874 [Taraxacum kok-saghyz]